MDFPFFVSQDELKENCAYSSRIPREVKNIGVPPPVIKPELREQFAAEKAAHWKFWGESVQ